MQTSLSEFFENTARRSAEELVASVWVVIRLADPPVLAALEAGEAADVVREGDVLEF